MSNTVETNAEIDDWNFISTESQEHIKIRLKEKMPQVPRIRKKFKFIKKTEKYTRYTISHKTRYHHPIFKKLIPNGSYSYIYEHPDKLVFKTLSYCKTTGNNIIVFSDTKTVGVLKHKNEKFNFYYKNYGQNWMNGSNNANKIDRVIHYYNGKKIHCKRTASIISKFVQKFGRKFIKTNGQNMITSGIIRLCYPVLENLLPQNIPIKYINNKYTKYLRGKLNSKFVKSLVPIQENQGKYPRFFKYIYSAGKDFNHIVNHSLCKYIKLTKEKVAFLMKGNNEKVIDKPYLTEEDCDVNVKYGKFKEIPCCEVALM